MVTDVDEWKFIFQLYWLFATLHHQLLKVTQKCIYGYCALYL